MKVKLVWCSTLIVYLYMIAWNLFKGMKHNWAKMAEYVNKKCENTKHPCTGPDMKTWQRVYLQHRKTNEKECKKAQAQPKAKVESLVVDYQVK